MIINQHQAMHLAKSAGISRAALARQTGISERHLYSIQKDANMPSAKSEWDLLEVLYAEFNFPWSLQACRQAFSMQQLVKSKQISQLQNLYGFSGDQAVQFAKELDCANELTSSDWGNILVGYLYSFALANANNSQLTPLYDEAFLSITTVYSTALGAYSADWARILRQRLSMNVVVYKWDKTPKDARNTKTMRDFVERHLYLENLLDCTGVVPPDETDLFNALAVCSRFEDNTRYSELLNLLKTSNNRWCDLRKISDQEFDSDFDHFKKWASRRRLFSKTSTASNTRKAA